MEIQTDEFARARQEFEEVLKRHELPETTARVQAEILARSTMRKYFMVEHLGPGQKATYPLPDEFEAPIWILPGMGYVAQDYIEILAEEFTIPTFTVQAAKDWLLKYQFDSRADILKKAITDVAKAMADYETEAAWRTIIPPVTSAWDGAGVLPPRPAPVYKMHAKDPASGYFSKELINRMIVGAKRLGRNLTEIIVSPEDMADIREWTDADVDPVTRRGIMQAAGKGSIWSIKLTERDDIGLLGKYNINGRDSDYGCFCADKNNRFNDYIQEHGNIVDSNGNLVVAGETQVIGLCDNPTDYLIMPVKQEYIALFDYALIRRMKTGFFGWQQFGMACMDARNLVMGVVDRYTPSMKDYTLTDAKVRRLSAHKEYLETLIRLLSK